MITQSNPTTHSVIPGTVLHTHSHHILGEYDWIDCSRPWQIWPPITSESVKRSVKLTDAITCQDCFLYMRIEENSLYCGQFWMHLSRSVQYSQSHHEKQWCCRCYLIGVFQQTHGIFPLYWKCMNTVWKSPPHLSFMQLLKKPCWKVLPFSIVLQGVGVGVSVHRLHCLLHCGHLLAVCFGDVWLTILYIHSNPMLQ